MIPGMQRAILVSMLTALWLALTGAVAAAAPALPALGADPQATTASGISSGGYMAVQLHVAHSSTIRGVGVLAAGPFYCAQGSAWTARYNCMQPGGWTQLPPVAVLTAATEVMARGGQIDPVEGLREARVWLFSGTRDDTVRRPVVEALYAYYRAWVPPPQIALVREVPAGHAMVTADYGGSCSLTAAPYINDCDFDAAGALLEHLYGRLNAPGSTPGGDLARFDQRAFTPAGAYAMSMDDEGFVYIPSACRAGGCRIHVALHGCLQGREQAGEQFVRQAGYNRWADTNRLIVLYPQAIARWGWGPWPWPTSFVYNPNGCWDWWGYTGASYPTRLGLQIRAVKAMIDRLAARP
jgi:poly(3-hydroxybutyrate) depolymerase